MPARRQLIRALAGSTAVWVLGGLAVVGLPGAAPATGVGIRAPTGVTALSETVAPGVTYEELQVDGGTGPVLVHVVRVDPTAAGVGFDLASGHHVASRQPVADLMDADAVAAVNGDFFDIRDTDAPLGVAVDRQRGLRNGVALGWNDAFWLGADDRPHIGPLTLSSWVRATPGHPAVAVAGVDSASVPAGAVGLYDRRWGTLRSRRVVDGQRLGVRLVAVRDGRVVATRTRLPATLVTHDVILVGRGPGAAALSQLDVGERVRIRSQLSRPAAVALTGSDYLLRGGVPVTNTSPDPHFVGGHLPRTGVGIDRDTGQVLLVTVDGRSAGSAGMSLPDLSRLFDQLGAEDALNLDGGGSATMVTRGIDGSLSVRNTPSDGRPRAVANGLEVTYDPPG